MIRVHEQNYNQTEKIYTKLFTIFYKDFVFNLKNN